MVRVLEESQAAERRQLRQSIEAIRTQKRQNKGKRSASSSTNGHEATADESMSMMSYDDDLNSVSHQSLQDYLSSGQFIVLNIEISKEDASAISEFYSKHGFYSVFGLLKHENKLSVLHFNVQRCEGFEEPIKAKDELLFHVGFRKYWTKPIFSELNLNCDKHRSERFFRVRYILQLWFMDLTYYFPSTASFP